MGHWSAACSRWKQSGTKRAQDPEQREKPKDQQLSQKTNWWEALEARSLTGGQRREKRKSMPQPAGGIWSSQGHSFATLIKGFLLLALPCCGFLRQKWLCYWVSTGAWKQLWVCGLPGCRLSPLNASLGPLGPEPFISCVSSDSHWVYSVICFVNCCSQGIIPSWSFTLQSPFLFCPKCNFKWIF